LIDDWLGKFAEINQEILETPETIHQREPRRRAGTW